MDPDERVRRSISRGGRGTARPDLRRWRIEGTLLLEEIRATAEVMAAAQRLDAERGAGSEAGSLLRAVERTQGMPSIADVARALRIKRQSAHELVRRAAQAGLVELFRNRRDKRIRQIRLTAAGRSMLAAARAREAEWVIELLNGLDRRTIRATSHVLSVLRRRLERRTPETRRGRA